MAEIDTDKKNRRLMVAISTKSQKRRYPTTIMHRGAICYKVKGPLNAGNA
jgi:hypothetical protein